MKLNLLKPLLCLALGSFVLATSCMKLEGTKPNEDKDNGDFKNTVVPANFKWEMSRSVSCDFTSTDNRLTMVNLSVEKDGEPFATFYVGGDADKVKLTLPSITDEVYATYVTDAIGAKPQEPVKLSVKNGVLSYTVPADAKDFNGSVGTRSAATKSQGGGLINYPATGWGTIMFEDLWPSYGDYDFNDVVLGYKIMLHPHNKNKVKEMTIGLQVRCVGGTLPYDLFLRIKDIKGGEIEEVFSYNPGTKVEISALNNKDNVKEDAVIEIKGLKPSSYYNNMLTNNIEEPKLVTVNFYIALRNAVEIGDLNDDSFEFFLANAVEPRREIHQPGYEPVFDLENYHKVAKSNSNTNKSAKFYYSNTNLVWAIKVPLRIRHTIESKSFSKAYPDFTNWIKSGGEENKDWYKNTKTEDLMPL